MADVIASLSGTSAAGHAKWTIPDGYDPAEDRLCIPLITGWDWDTDPVVFLTSVGTFREVYLVGKTTVTELDSEGEVKSQGPGLEIGFVNPPVTDDVVAVHFLCVKEQ